MSAGGFRWLDSAGERTLPGFDGLDPDSFQAVAADLDGDGVDEVVGWDPTSGVWQVAKDAWAETLAVFGAIGDVPVPGDYDGDGDDELAVFRPTTGEWIIEGTVEETWGQSGDIAVPGRWKSGDEVEPAIYRPSTGEWYVLSEAPMVWGVPGDVPVPGDYGGTGRTVVAVFRPSRAEWLIPMGNPITFTVPGGTPMALDLDGDGLDDFTMLDPAGRLVSSDGTELALRPGRTLISLTNGSPEAWYYVPTTCGSTRDG